ncbi:E3 ubiquitin-protein ligase hrd1 [Coniothyrium glycines]
MSRLKLYVAGSAVMANVVLLRAYYERPNFYSAAVYISQSTGSLMFLVNLMLIVAVSVGYALQRLFYGPLRAIETEQLYDKAWFAVSETLLAMTIFRDDIGIWFFTMFLCLLAGKVWQWIGEGRVEFLEQQPPANPRLFHARLMSSLFLSVAFDIFMMQYCIDSILSDARPGVMVMFGFEYVLLAIASISTLMRYTLSLVEIYMTHRQEQAREQARLLARTQARQHAESEGTQLPMAPDDDDDDDDEGDVPGWEEKGRWVFYLDLATDLIKTVVYLGFFMILMTFYGIPIHIMRDLFMTIRSLIKRINDFVQYRSATRDMNTRYPDATAEELDRENTCIVCREEMRPWAQPGADGAQTERRMDERQRPKKLPCGHILHFSCLRSWLERQQTTQANNAVNQAQPNQANQQGPGAFQGLFNGHQQGQIAPQNAAAPQGQGEAPVGNMRVFNLGPIRIALGNLRLPPGQRNNPNNIRNAMDQLRQQANQAGQGGQANAHQNQMTTPFPAVAPHSAPTGPVPGAVALHPSDVQSDILRIQQNIIESMRQLNVQHEQLEVLYRLVGELNRIQQVSGLAAATGLDLPPIASLNPPDMSTFMPQAFVARGNALRQGDAGVPEGLTLPDGWTLTPMSQTSRGGATHHGQAATQSSLPTRDAQGAAAPPRSVDTEASSMQQDPSTAATANATASTASTGPGTKATEPSSLESSWSFGNVGERNEAEGSSSAVARSNADGAGIRRTATVEDDEDMG